MSFQGKIRLNPFHRTRNKINAVSAPCLLCACCIVIITESEKRALKLCSATLNPNTSVASQVVSKEAPLPTDVVSGVDVQAAVWLTALVSGVNSLP